MYKRFCAKCGKQTDKLIEGLCPECYRESTKKFEKIEKEIKRCIYCHRVFYSNKWVSFDEFQARLEKKYSGNITYKDDYLVIESPNKIIELKIIYKASICNTCKKYINQRGYNYVLQLRGDANKIKEILDKIYKNALTPINIEELKEGLDVYFNINRKEFKLLLKIIKNYNDRVKITRKLIKYDKQRSKFKYRVYISLRV